MKKLHDDKLLGMLYEEIKNTMISHVLRLQDTQLVASTMISIAFRLYKTTLTDEEYKDMLKVVLKNAKKTQPFNMERMH